MFNSLDYAACQVLFETYGIGLTKTQFLQFTRYAVLLQQEASVQNVTAVSEPNEIWIRHFLDSAYLLQYLGNASLSVLDVGTGGGMPGIPLAILSPSFHITLLDSELRKIEFCQKVIQELELHEHVTTICGRAEELAKLPAYRGRFDIAVSRAMANGSMLTELSIPMLRVGGCLFAMKGRNYDPLVERFAEAAEVLGAKVCATHRYILNGEEKCLVQIEKTAETATQYPRRFAKIKRNPL